MSIPEDELSKNQKLALSQLREIDYKGLGAIDASSALSNSDMLDMLNIYDRLFFFNALNVSFSWEDLSSDNATGYYSPRSGRILLDPKFVDPTTIVDTHGRKTQRLMAILHEAIHALLEEYSCQSCPTHDVNVENAQGHGRAFMIIANAIEEACERLLDRTITLDIGNDLRGNWQQVRHLPSIHDLRMWNLVDEDMVEQWRRSSQRQNHIAAVIGALWRAVVEFFPKPW